MTESDVKLNKELKHFRKELHRSAFKLVWSFGWVNRENLIREVKNIFLWTAYKVETSRALSLEQLKEGIRRIRKMPRSFVLNHLVDGRNFCTGENDLLQITSQQKKKLVRIMVYVLKLSLERQLSYIEETLNNKLSIEQLTVNEANTVIRRVEKWEAKILLKK